jgi:hypothetical protein
MIQVAQPSTALSGGICSDLRCHRPLLLNVVNDAAFIATPSH